VYTISWSLWKLTNYMALSIYTTMGCAAPPWWCIYKLLYVGAVCIYTKRSKPFPYFILAQTRWWCLYIYIYIYIYIVSLYTQKHVKQVLLVRGTYSGSGRVSNGHGSINRCWNWPQFYFRGYHVGPVRTPGHIWRSCQCVVSKSVETAAGSYENHGQMGHSCNTQLDVFSLYTWMLCACPLQMACSIIQCMSMLQEPNRCTRCPSCFHNISKTNSRKCLRKQPYFIVCDFVGMHAHHRT